MEQSNNEKEIYRKGKQQSLRKIQTFTLKLFGGLLLVAVITTSLLSLEFFNEYKEIKTVLDQATTVLFTASIGLILIMLGFERSLDFSNIDSTMENQNKSLKDLNSSIENQNVFFQNMNNKTGNVITKLDELKLVCDRINVQTDLINEMESLKSHHFDSYLTDVFSDLIDKNILFLKEGIQNKRVVFTEHDTFELAYSKTLEKIGPCEFFATAAANSNYFWTQKGEANSTVENSVKRFINSGGKMKRIFFTDDDKIHDQQILDILDKQLELGVEVYLLSKKYVSDYINEYFGVDENNTICWNVFTDETQKIKRFVYSINQTDAKKFTKRFEKLMSNSHIIRYGH